MRIKTLPYSQTLVDLPKAGQFILGHQSDNEIVVYQAYNSSIADFALQNQYLGGTAFNYNRMSWIKTNFLWMMYRCGWAENENQERILAFWIAKSDFGKILREAVFSSYNPTSYETHEKWKDELTNKEVRLQWDPDHGPFGNKLERRAIQLGLKGKVLETFGKQQIKLIEDITDFVMRQKQHLDNNQLDKLTVPVETVFRTTNSELNKKLGIQ
jgi:hypothetical protein